MTIELFNIWWFVYIFIAIGIFYRTILSFTKEK